MPQAPNVILIILDTLRKDVIHAYGGTAETPNLDEFCSDAVVYGNAVAPAPWTIPSHVSMLTGKYPSEHGIHETRETKVKDLLKLKPGNDNGLNPIQSVLRKKGYNTIGISANPILLENVSGLGGFGFLSTLEEEYYKWPSSITEAEVEAWSKYASSKPNIKSAAFSLLRKGRIQEVYMMYSIRRRLKRHKRSRNYPLIKNGDRVADFVTRGWFEEPFFLMLNFFEMHEPYTKYELSRTARRTGIHGWDAALLGVEQMPVDALQKIRHQYRLEAAQLDRFLGQLFGFWKSRKIYDNSLIIVTSDHGQALMERGYLGHGIFLHDEITEIPMIVKYPRNRKSSDSKGYQSLVDIPLLINQVAEGGGDEGPLSSESVFSESFGMQWVPEARTPRIISKVDKIRENYDHSRKAIYSREHKLTVNWDSGNIEEFTHKGRQVDPNQQKEIFDDLRTRLEAFSQKETESSFEQQPLSRQEEAEIEARLRNLGYA